MHNALRMDDHFYLIVWNPEKKMRFNNFQRFVGERCAIDRDLAAHRPGRMLQRIGKRRAGNLIGTPGAKRTAARRDHESPDITAIAPSEALQNRRMLTVHGNDLTTTAFTRCRGERACHHERFLVRERHTFAGFECRECRIQTGSANNGVEHDIHIVARRRFDQRIRTNPPIIRHVCAIRRNDSDKHRRRVTGLFAQQCCI